MAEIRTHVGIIERGELLASGRVDEIMRRLQGHRVVTVRALATPESARAVVVDDGALAGARSSAATDQPPARVTLPISFRGDEQGQTLLLADLIARRGGATTCC